ncbi:MAG: phosphotransferase [Candidatus Falkowbacteria bacterium]
MNKIEQLFDEEYVRKLLSRKILSFYPDYQRIEKVRVIPHKKHIWESTYHVVVEFLVYFETHNKKVHKLSIFCSAHSNENRKNVYDSLKFLWEAGFSDEHFSIPRPLFYSAYFNGTFYRGVDGRNLHYYISTQNHEEIEKVVPQAAKWFAKLHNLKSVSDFDYNSENGRIRTVIPGIDDILKEIKKKYPHYLNFYEKAYDIFIRKEEEFLNSADRLWLIHGDAHPENIIKMNDIKTAIIDFTDMSVADFTRDIGCFLQQFEYMGVQKKKLDPDYVAQIRKLFLDTYFANSPEKLDADVKDRIDNYYNWTMMRTITYLLTAGVINRDEAKLQKINDLVNLLKNNLGI